MDAYPDRGQPRAGLHRVARLVADRTGCTLADGLGRVLSAPRGGGERISGFMERHTYGEWKLGLRDSRPLVWRTDSAPAADRPEVAFLLSIAFGNGSPLPQPSGRWDLWVNDRFALSFRVVNHRQLWRGDRCRLAFAPRRIETARPFESLTLSSTIRDEAFAAFGPALLAVPADWLDDGRAATLTVRPAGEFDSTRWFQLDQAPAAAVQGDVHEVAGVLAGDRPTVAGQNVYFGDIHTHSGQNLDACDETGCGRGSREENYRYALGPGGLDFYALTDHEWQIGEGARAYFDLADRYDRPGRFATLPAYEFTNLLYGHRNVYFRDRGSIVVNANRTGRHPTWDPDATTTPEALWEALAEAGERFLTVPHHPSSASHPCTWDHWNPEYDRLIEVYSVWGSSEYYGDFPRGVSDRYRTLDVRDALRRGLRFGLVASADGHDGHPGNAQSPLVKHHHQFHFCGSGRAAVLADELTRQAVWDALHDRRCYATTGAPIVLDVRVGDRGMGACAPAPPEGRRVAMSIRCEGTNGIEQVRIVKNGRVVQTYPACGEWSFQAEWEDPHTAPEAPASYYVRVVQKDYESAWSSPIWLGEASAASGRA